MILGSTFYTVTAKTTGRNSNVGKMKKKHLKFLDFTLKACASLPRVFIPVNN